MLTFGYDLINVPQGTMIFNLSSLIEGYPVWDILPPYEVVTNQREFDIMYADYLLGPKFKDFMNVIMSLYYGINVHILVSRGDYFEALTESVSKLIQQRYGYISSTIEEPDDMNYAVEGEFSINGLYNLDMDKEKFSYLTVNVDEELRNQ